MMKPWRTHSQKETKQLGTDIAAFISTPIFIDEHSTYARVLALSGNLGSGKTTLTQGLFSGFGIREPAVSPTFTIMRAYPIKKGQFHRLYHIDAYRLEKASELAALGFRELISNSKNLIVVEWADIVQALMPKDTIWIKLRHTSRESERTISFYFPSLS